MALVTGASRGIGRAIAMKLAETGHFVLINYRSREAEARQTLAEIEKAGGQGELSPFDVADPSACEKAVESCVQERTAGSMCS